MCEGIPEDLHGVSHGAHFQEVQCGGHVGALRDEVRVHRLPLGDHLMDTVGQLAHLIAEVLFAGCRFHVAAYQSSARRRL